MLMTRDIREETNWSWYIKHGQYEVFGFKTLLLNNAICLYFPENKVFFLKWSVVCFVSLISVLLSVSIVTESKCYLKKNAFTSIHVVVIK